MWVGKHSEVCRYMCVAMTMYDCEYIYLGVYRMCVGVCMCVFVRVRMLERVSVKTTVSNKPCMITFSVMMYIRTQEHHYTI